VAVGGLAAALCTQLAAGFLTLRLARAGHDELTEAFCRRGLQASTAVLVLGTIALAVVAWRSPPDDDERQGSRSSWPSPAYAHGALMSPISRGFRGRPRPQVDPSRVPPGQYVTTDFPVLSAGPTPRVSTAEWRFTIDGAVDAAASWSWGELLALPQETFTVDIHCVTKWSKLDTAWTGVSVDTLLGRVSTGAAYLTASSYGGYTTNLALEDVTGGQAWVVHTFAGEPLEPEHGGPARLLVPHLYFWKSAKWVRGLTITVRDEPGFWEVAGYNNHGDPWREQRYWSD